MNNPGMIYIRRQIPFVVVEKNLATGSVVAKVTGWRLFVAGVLASA